MVFRTNFVTGSKNFLSDRTQAVRVNNSISDMTNVLSGCPQGTSSAPIFFLIFINDIVDIFDQVKVKILLII